MAAKKSGFPWAWVGCGCAFFVILGASVIVGIGWFGKMAIDDLEAELKDPVARDAKALKILGGEAMPEGWYAAVPIRIPFLMDMVMLSKGEPPPMGVKPGDDGNDLGDDAFIFVNLHNVGDARADVDRALESGEDPENVEMGFRSREIVGRGTFELPYAGIRWVAHRGDFERSRGGGEGVYAMFAVDCNESDSRVRMGFFWSVLEGEDASIEGTPADENELKRFSRPVPALSVFLASRLGTTGVAADAFRRALVLFTDEAPALERQATGRAALLQRRTETVLADGSRRAAAARARLARGGQRTVPRSVQRCNAARVGTMTSRGTSRRPRQTVGIGP